MFSVDGKSTKDFEDFGLGAGGTSARSLLYSCSARASKLSLTSILRFEYCRCLGKIRDAYTETSERNINEHAYSTYQSARRSLKLEDFS
jgi:hypothetical protein